MVVLELVQAAFEPARDAERARAMSAYMRDLFPFVGIPNPERVKLERAALVSLPRLDAAAVISEVRALWAAPEREYQYCALGLLDRNVRALTADSLPFLRELVTTKSWWDTVDHLASHVVGAIVANHPELKVEMDAWAADENLWVARSAILHQLRYKSKTDADRLFGYCATQAGHHDFFIRKAIGWALREYSKTDEQAVRRFVVDHEAELSGLSKREALLWLNGGRKKRTA